MVLKISFIKDSEKLLYTISRTTPLSKLDKALPYLWAHLPQYGWINNPKITGSNTSNKSPIYNSPNTLTSPTSKKKCINNGVIATPINPEIEALKMAAGTFPRAMDTITTDEVTVEGSAAKK